MTPQRPPGLLAPMHRWSLRRRVAAGFGALAALLAVVVTVSVLSLVGFITSGDAVVYRWEPATARSQDLLSDLVIQETGVRGYALTGRAELLQPYYDYLQEERADEQKLSVYLRGHANLLRRLESFRVAVDEWRSTTAEPLIQLVRSGDPAAASRVDDAVDQARSDAIRQRSADLTHAVAGMSAHARSDRRDALDLHVATLAAAALIVGAAAVFIWRGLHRWVLGPVDHLAAQTREVVAAGHPDAQITPLGPPEFVALGQDVETMRQAGADMLATVETSRAELARSNADLEQFAYVASHDLSEPLRKVANFCQLLERQYGEQLDDKAKQYIYFAVDGSKRMQVLINDLLALSRVGRSIESFAAVDTGAALTRALDNLEEQIASSGAGVGYIDLPTVVGDESLLVSLFENLVGNAIKYRGKEPPLIAVTATLDAAGHMWTFTVSDNGIGIDPQYGERIFAIFQRLHLRDEYGGTGIGLALCRKIVEFHGGRIWLDTQTSGSGATFRFTLPEGSAGDR
jgi:signal transduction histidine kinase